MNETHSVLLSGLADQLRTVLVRFEAGGDWYAKGALTVPSLISLAACVHDLGDRDEAKALLRRALEISSETTPGHIESATSAMVSLGVLAQEHGELSEATQWYEQALAPLSSATVDEPHSRDDAEVIRELPEPGAHLDNTRREHVRRLVETVTRLSDDIIAGVAGEPRWLLSSEDWAESRLHRAVLAGEATAAIWDEPMLKPGAAATALGAKSTNREKVKTYRERSWLLGLPHGNGYVYPAFQFDRAKRDLHEEVREVNESLGSNDDPWGVASWWVSTHARLGDRPRNLVGTERKMELTAAAAAVSELIG